MAGASVYGSRMHHLNTGSMAGSKSKLIAPAPLLSRAMSPSFTAVSILKQSTLPSLRGNLHSSAGWNCGSSSSRQLGFKKLSTKRCRVLALLPGQDQNPARDRVVDFGKNKGAMMGTLSSKYLRWMVKNLQTGPLSEWSQFAAEVLADPYYQDRLEWEKVEKLMAEAHDMSSATRNR
jgi:hypothetical protein